MSRLGHGTVLSAAAVFWAAVMVVAPMTVQVATADPVTVRAGAHKGYGRLVFNWPTPVPFTANLQGKTLVVRFGRPIEASYDGAVRALRKYLQTATPGSDGRSVSFTLKGAFSLRSFDMGRAVVVDVVDSDTTEKIEAETKTATATTDNSTEPIAKKTSRVSKVPTVKVRTGAHKDYTRVVFDWPHKVGYRLDQAGGDVTVTFDRPATININRLRTRPPQFIKGARSKKEGDGVAVTLQVADTSRIRHFLSGAKVVIDISAPGTAPKAKPNSLVKKSPIEKRQVEVPLAKAPPAIEVKVVKKTSLADLSAKEAAQESSSSRASESMPATKEAAAAALDKPTPLVPGKPKALTPVAQTGKPAAASIHVSENAATLRFDWPQQVAAAVFRRAGYLWVVFDEASTVDVAAIAAKVHAAAKASKTANDDKVIQAIRQFPAEQATALRFRTATDINPALRRDGLAWVLELRKQPLLTPVTIKAQAQPKSPVGARVFLPVPEPGSALIVKDPEVGDNLIVVPVVPLGHGVAQASDYPQFHILTSAQGVVIEPKIDALKVRPLRQGIELTSPGKLQISAMTTAMTTASEGEAAEGPMRQLSRVLDLKQWRDSDLSTYTEEKRKLEFAIAKAKPARREKKRMELAEYYFAHRFAAEALGILQQLAIERPAIRDQAKFRVLRGASNVLMGHIAKAGVDLKHPVLRDVDEARFWQSAMQAFAGDLPGAARPLRRFGAIIRPYPRALKVPLGMLVAEGALSIGSYKTAKDYLNLVNSAELDSAEQGRFAYLSGRLKELAGDTDGAVTSWEQAMASPNRPSRAKSTIARVELLLSKKTMTALEAIAEMEKLRFIWRGDEFEFNLLRRLGGLYMQVGDYRNGLRILRQAVTHFRAHEKTAEIAQTMADSFAKLYLDDAADTLAPVTAIALYDEFKELTPAGAKGDELIRKLADRLVGVDLLDRASTLLEAQVEFRLKGTKKSEVGARLALVHILNRKPEEAMRVLKQSETSGMPRELADQRRHLMARALSDVKRTDDALLLLKEDKSVEAELLRADIYWDLRDWPRTARALRQLLRAFGAKSGKPVNEKQGKYLLNLATVLILSGNQRAVNRLRQNFGAAVDKTSFRDAFRLIAGAQPPGLTDYRTVGRKVAQAENFKGFLGAYRERLKNEKLSDLTSSDSGG